MKREPNIVIDYMLWALVVGAWYALATAPLWATYIGD